jgi:hypothetical protein
MVPVRQDRPVIVTAPDRLKRLAEVRVSPKERAKVAREWERARQSGR